MERIEINPKIMVGKPVIRGTRITVEHILEFLENGKTIEDILDRHPRLTKQDIFAALGYAKKIVADNTESYAPTPYLEKILEEVDRDIKAGKNISPTFDNVEDMVEWLNNPKRKYERRIS